MSDLQYKMLPTELDDTVSDDPFGFLLVTAARLVRARYEHALEQASLGLTPAEARMLVSAERYQPVRQTDLAIALGIEPMTLVNHLDRLEIQGLIRRETSSRDRRSKEVVVTEEAKPAIRSIRRVLNEANAQALTSFTTQERSQFTALLERLCHDLNPGMIPAAEGRS